MDIESKTAAVIDASYLLTYLLPDEADATVNKFFKDVSSITLYAPKLLEYEVANGVASAMKYRRINKSEGSEAWHFFKKLPIRYLEADLEKAIEISTSHNLSVYDASYIAIAQEHGCKLFTLDKKMKKLLLHS